MLNRTSVIATSIRLGELSTFVFADDLAFHIYGRTQSNVIQGSFKNFVLLLEEVSNLEITINSKKSAHMPLFKPKKLDQTLLS